MRNGSNPKFRPAASRATVASSSSRSRNPVLSAAAAREYHYGARKLCPRGKPGLLDAVAHLAAWATDLAEEVRSNSTTHQKRAHQPYEGPPAAIGCRSCGRFTMGFVTGSSQSLGSGENLIQDQSRIGQFSSGLAIIRLIFRFERPTHGLLPHRQHRCRCTMRGQTCFW